MNVKIFFIIITLKSDSLLGFCIRARKINRKEVKMSSYEVVFILADKVDESGVKSNIENFKGVIEKAGSSVVKVDNWGKKTLAYEIDKNRKGTYILFEVEGDGQFVKELERKFRISEDVIRYLTVKKKDKKKAKAK